MVPTFQLVCRSACLTLSLPPSPLLAYPLSLSLPPPLSPTISHTLSPLSPSLSPSRFSSLSPSPSLAHDFPYSPPSLYLYLSLTLSLSLSLSPITRGSVRAHGPVFHQLSAREEEFDNMAVEHYSSDNETSPTEAQPNLTHYLHNGMQCPQALSYNGGYGNNDYYNSWAFASQFQPMFPHQYYYPTPGMQLPVFEPAPAPAVEAYSPEEWQEQVSSPEEPKCTDDPVVSSAWKSGKNYDDWSSNSSSAAYSSMSNMYSMFPWMQISRQVKWPDSGSCSAYSPNSRCQCHKTCFPLSWSLQLFCFDPGTFFSQF